MKEKIQGEREKERKRCLRGENSCKRCLVAGEGEKNEGERGEKACGLK